MLQNFLNGQMTSKKGNTNINKQLLVRIGDK